MNIQEFARTVLDVELADYQREMLENIPETKPAGMPDWGSVRLPFYPQVTLLLAAQCEVYLKGLRVVTGPTQDGKKQTNEA